MAELLHVWVVGIGAGSSQYEEVTTAGVLAEPEKSWIEILAASDEREARLRFCNCIGDIPYAEITIWRGRLRKTGRECKHAADEPAGMFQARCKRHATPRIFLVTIAADHVEVALVHTGLHLGHDTVIEENFRRLTLDQHTMRDLGTRRNLYA